MKASESDTGSPTEQLRLLSLDVFRGLDVALMVFVNMTWDRAVFHSQLFHVGWNDGEHGATLTDLVFPWFLFISGVAIPWSMASGRGRGRGAAAHVWQGFKRGLVIYTLGTLLSAARSQHFEILTLDILQFIGIAYFVGVCVAQLPRWAWWVFAGVVLLGKYVLMHHVPHPAHGVVMWTPEENLRNWISAYDFGLGGWNRVPQWLCNGLFNILPGAAVVVMGSLVGDRIRNAWTADGAQGRLAGVLLLVGLGLWGVSYALQLVDPYSKDYFTASYALLATGTGTALLAVLYWVCDVRRWTKMTWARVFGLNALAFYVANEALFRVVLSRWTQPWVEVDGARLNLVGLMRWAPLELAERVWGETQTALVVGRWAWVLLYMLGWWVLFAWLYWRRWFWRV